MATITNAQVEALARQILWDQIDASTWHAGNTGEQRTAAIAADVKAWWHLRAGEAARLLVERLIDKDQDLDLIPLSSRRACFST